MQPLIDAASLARALAEPGAAERARPVVLDVRWRLGGAQAAGQPAAYAARRPAPPGLVSYRAGHVPGAIFIDLDSELCGPPGPGGRHPLPVPADFQNVMRRAGVSAGRLVVVYDDAEGFAAARAWWTLRYFGHDAAQVLDGGYRGWAAAGHPVERGTRRIPARARGNFTATAGGMPVLDAGEAGRLARYGVLLDARAAERYRGEVEPIDPVAGHIPGAVSAPTADNVDGDGRFKSPAELRAHFASFGADAEALTGVYCGSGVYAAHEVLALSLAGIPAALYVGSWSEWITDPGRPVTVGAGDSGAAGRAG